MDEGLAEHRRALRSTLKHEPSGAMDDGGMWLRSREHLEEGDLPDLEAREEVDFDGSDEDLAHHWVRCKDTQTGKGWKKKNSGTAVERTRWGNRTCRRCTGVMGWSVWLML